MQIKPALNLHLGIPKTEEPKPEPKPEPEPEKPVEEPVNEHEGHHDIMGESVVSSDKMVAFVRSINPTAQDIEEIAKSFIEVGKTYGIRGDTAFIQSIIETSWFKFDNGTAVTPDQHNYCGMGVTQKGMKGNSFETVNDGVTAQIQHLYAYANKLELPSGEILLDPRFKYVTRGIAPHWEDLSMRWAMNENYGNQILARYNDMVSFEYTPPVIEEPVEEPKEENPVNSEELIKVIDYLFDKIDELLYKINK